MLPSSPMTRRGSWGGSFRPLAAISWFPGAFMAGIDAGHGMELKKAAKIKDSRTKGNPHACPRPTAALVGLRALRWRATVQTDCEPREWLGQRNIRVRELRPLWMLHKSKASIL